MLRGQAVWALGAASGRGLDGVAAALLRSDGESIFEFGRHRWRPYTAGERAVLRAALGCWPGAPQVEPAAEVVETACAELLSGFPEADLVGFGGLTLAHEPGGRGTHQAGSGAVLAEVLGRPVVWDIASTDVRLGGQGAPLAPYFHFACARWLGLRGPLVLLDLGAVASLSWIDPAEPGPEVAGACMAFDAGPGGALLADLPVAAAQGEASAAIVARCLAQPFFLKIPPKALDRAAFDWLLAAVAPLAAADAAATIIAVIAQAVARGFEHFPAAPTQVLVSGAGRRNTDLMAMLTATLPCPVVPVEAAGLNGDMLAAQAIAYLALRVARGLPTSGPTTTGVPAQVSGGQISRP
jgi:anhydro-N-acetylmuramic acid kinase